MRLTSCYEEAEASVSQLHVPAIEETCFEEIKMSLFSAYVLVHVLLTLVVAHHLMLTIYIQYNIKYVQYIHCNIT